MRNKKPLALGEQPRKAKPLLHTPFPGLMDGTREWTVKEGRWPAFLERTESSGVMHVPLGGSEVERKLRLQESAHATWTPPVTQEEVESWAVQERTIDACEDGRIIALMNQTNDEWKEINQDYSVLSEGQIEQHRGFFQRLYDKLSGVEEPAGAMMGEPPSLVEAARLIASSRGYAEAGIFDECARQMPWIPEMVNELHRKHLWKEKPTFADTVAYAQELERTFSEIEKRLMEQAETMREANMDRSYPDPTEDSDEDYAWGEMEIQRVPLPERLRKQVARRTRPADTGAVPRYMHRLVSDQRVFGRKRKEEAFQGTVLIDHSGSMGLSASQVDEILARWPAVTIATYSGDYDGVLRIIAEKGRRAAHRDLGQPSGAGNCVDGPALDWLCKQRGPRVWISDGRVSGQGEDFRPWFNRDAAQKVIRGKIKRIDEVQELLGS